MKHLPWLPALLFALLPAAARAQTAAESLAQVKKLSEQGNHREAADLGKAALTKADATGELLEATLSALGELNADMEQEEVIESSVKTHSKKWDILLVAGQGFSGSSSNPLMPAIGGQFEELEHVGTLIDGKFQRGQYLNQGKQVSTVFRDRVRSLQLVYSAWKALSEDAPKKARSMILDSLGKALAEGQDSSKRAWSLLHLTDLTTLPDFDDQSGLDEPASGYPVDAEGNPIFFKAATSWETAKNDGERLLWIMESASKLGPDDAREYRQHMADLMKSWFSVQTLAEYGFRFDAGEEEGSTKSSIATLHTLKDDETVAKLATGPKRFALLEGANFMHLYQMLAEDAEASADMRVSAWLEIADELRDRRQYSRAVEALTKAVALEDDANQKKGLQAQLDQITGNWGRFEPQGAMPAGKEAKLQLVFRNAKKISLSARKVDVVKLLADTEAYLRSEPQEPDWSQLNISSIGQRLLEKDGDKYLGKPAAEWSQELEPRANHWDKRVDVPTPLKNVGAYFVEGTFEGGNKTRALLWLEGLVIVKTMQANAAHYFVADAVTGTPVAGAMVKFFGHQQNWGHPGLLNREKKLYKFKDIQATTDEHGQVKVTD
ncbi:MAG: hypothetical protein ABL974_12275, partial [Prosthecobacter sp.]